MIQRIIMHNGNIFEHIIKSDKELFSEIIQHENIKIERIVSSGQTSPEDFWYDQQENEFVFLVQGHAIIEFEEEDVELKAGQYLNIKAHVKHRVKYTSLEEESIWLAVFY